MKLSVSLSNEDVAFLDARVARKGAASRSGALQEAVRLLRRADLEAEYAEHSRTGRPPVRRTSGTSRRPTD